MHALALPHWLEVLCEEQCHTINSYSALVHARVGCVGTVYTCIGIQCTCNVLTVRVCCMCVCV